MLRCLLAEFATLRRRHGVTSVSSVFLGGGTPSLMPLWLVERLLGEVVGEAEVEVTLEGNPGDMLGKVAGLRRAGVTRLSVGVQTLDNSHLALLNRDHTAEQALEVLAEALAAFPLTTSADMIFGRPGQGVAGWLEELGRVAGLGLPHLSTYQLTLERGTRLWKQVGRWWRSARVCR